MPPGRAAQLSDAAARLVATPLRLEIVQLLQEHGELSSQTLAEMTKTPLNSIHRNVTVLIDDGWVTVAATTGEHRRGPRERMLALTTEHDFIRLVEDLNSWAASDNASS